MPTQHLVSVSQTANQKLVAQGQWKHIVYIDVSWNDLMIYKKGTCGIVESFVFKKYFCPSSELSHSILAIAISQVSRTVLSESARNSLRIGTDDASEIAPIASAA